MNAPAHTPGPWGWEYYDRNPNRPVALSAGGVDVLLSTGNGSAAWAEVSEADQRLIAAAPDLLAELRDTVDWLDERAKVMREIASRRAPGGVVESLRADAARFEGRAVVIRQTILKATQGA